MMKTRLTLAMVALCGLSARAEDEAYVLEAGQTDTQTAETATAAYHSSFRVDGDLTIGGKMWMTGTSGVATTLTMTGGTMTIADATAGFGYSHGKAANGPIDATFEPDENGTFPKVTVVNGATSAITTPVKTHWNFGARYLYVGKANPGATSADGTIDLFDLQKNGRISLFKAYNYTSLTGRISVAGTCFLEKGSNYDAAGIFAQGAWQIDLRNNAALTISVNNQKGRFNNANVPARITGVGNVSVSQCVPENESPFIFNTGAHLDYTGKLTLSRSSGSLAWYRFIQNDCLGPNVTNVVATNSSDLYVELAEGTHQTVRNMTVTPAKLFSKGATLQLDATAAPLTFAANMPQSVLLTPKNLTYETDNRLVIEKIGVCDVDVSSTTNFYSLVLKGGRMRFLSDTHIQSLVCDGGTFVPNAGVTVVVDEGLSTLTGELKGPGGDDWPRGEHLICYYRGDDPTGLTAEVRFGDSATFTIADVTEGDYSGYKALKLTVEYLGETIHLNENDDEIDICSLMGGSLSKPCDIIIDEGVTNYNTTALTGAYPLTVKGGGVLVLTESSPDFTGDVYIEKASVRVTADRPFGTGKVTVRGSTDAGGTSRILFANTTEITLPNELFLASWGTSLASVAGAKKVTFGGTVTAPSGFAFSDAHATSNTDSIYWSFQGEVRSAAGKTIQMSGYAAAEFKAKVTVGTLYAQGGGSPTGIPKIHLYSAENEIDCLQSRWQGTIYAEAERAWGGGRIGSDTGYDMTFSLKDHDQTMTYVDAAIYTGTAMTKEAQIVAANAGATLTLTGASSSKTTKRMDLNGNVSLVLDSANAGFVQTFKGGTSTTRGTITVRSGTLSFTDDIDTVTSSKVLATNHVSLVNVPELNVAGGSIRISPIRDGIFAGVTNLTVSAGSFVVSGPGQDPFGPKVTTKAVVALSESGTVDIAEGLTVSVMRAKVGDEWLAAGDYTCEGGASDATELSSLTGKGVLSVRRNGPAGLVLIFR